MAVKYYPVEEALVQLLAPQITSRGARGASQGKGNSKTHQNPPKYHNNRKKNPQPVPTLPAAWVGTRAGAGPPLSPHEGGLQAV